MKNETIALKKSGHFYTSYNDDAVIIHHLLGYKFVPGTRKVGFPESSLERVINCLINYKINYEIIDKDKNLIDSKDYKKINNYQKIFREAIKKVQIEDRFALIEQEIRNLDDTDVLRVLEVLENEVRK